MPKCERCEQRVTSTDLRIVRDAEGQDLVVCSNCRRPAEVISGHLRPESEDDYRMVGLELFRYNTGAGVDYRVEVNASYAGLNVSYATTFNQVRKMVAELKEEREKKQLQLVKTDDSP